MPKFCTQINVRYFPYDEQHCKLKFGGWTYTFDVLDLRPVPGDQKDFDFFDPIDETPGRLLMMGMDLSYFQE